MDHKQFQNLIKQLYSVVSELEAMFPGRHFTPDGHMVGSIGECLVADAYNLELATASQKGFDAISINNKKVEIKATQAKCVSFRSEPEHVIVIKILKDGSFEEYFNGPGNLVWKQFADKKRPSNGQYQITLKQLKDLDGQVNRADKIQAIY